MSRSVFTRIAEGELPGEVVYQDEHCFALQDINPQAPVHYLIIPREPIATLDDLEDHHRQLIGHLHLVAARIAREQGFAEAGYRTLFNCNGDGGQTIYHIHLHLLAGRQMHWPPG
jgi:histidine triad (HIT) family protein